MSDTFGKQLTSEQQIKVLVAFTTALLFQLGNPDTPERTLLRELAIKNHAEHHQGDYTACPEQECLNIKNTMFMQAQKEATFRIADLDSLKQFKLRYNSPLVGTLRAWLEEQAKSESVIQLVG